MNLEGVFFYCVGLMAMRMQVGAWVWPHAWEKSNEVMGTSSSLRSMEEDLQSTLHGGRMLHGRRQGPMQSPAVGAANLRGVTHPQGA